MLSPRFQKMYSDKFTKALPVSHHSIDDEVKTEAMRLIKDEGENEKAITLLNTEQYVEEDPTALIKRSLAKTAIRNFEGAEKDGLIAAAISLRVASAALVNVALNAIEAKDYDKGLLYAQQAIECDSLWHAPWVNLFCAYVSKNELEKAWTGFDEMNKEWPDSFEDRTLRSYIENDGILSILRESPDFKQRIVKYIKGEVHV